MTKDAILREVLNLILLAIDQLRANEIDVPNSLLKAVTSLQNALAVKSDLPATRVNREDCHCVTIGITPWMLLVLFWR